MDNKTFMQSSGINIFIGTYQKHPSCKKSCGQDVKKAVMKKCEIKRGQPKNAVDHITILIMMIQTAKHFSQAAKH